MTGFKIKIWQLPTLPHTCACSTIGVYGLNFSVRNGKRCDPVAKVTRKLLQNNRKIEVEIKKAKGV